MRKRRAFHRGVGHTNCYRRIAGKHWKTARLKRIEPERGRDRVKKKQDEKSSLSIKRACNGSVADPTFIRIN